MFSILFIYCFCQALAYAIVYIVSPYSLVVSLYTPLAILITLLFLFADKVLLSLLAARETVESLHTTFFQRVKHISFKLGVETPRVYIYKGRVSRIFTLVSRRNLSLVFEYKLLKHLNDQELDALITYMLGTYKVGGGRRRTLAYFVSSVCIKTLYETKEFFSKFLKNEEIVKAIAFLQGLVIKPVVELMFDISFTKSEIRKVDNFLTNELRDPHFLRSALTKLSYRKFNRDLLGNTLISFLLDTEQEEIKFVDIFEVFPSIESGLRNL